MKKQIKISFLLLLLSAVSAVFHNIFYAIFKFEEPVFFLLTFIFLLGFLVMLIYGLITIFYKKGIENGEN